MVPRCEGCGTTFGLHDGWCPVCLTERLAALETAIVGHCALLTGHSDHTENVTDCLGAVHAKVAELEQKLVEAADTIAGFGSVDADRLAALEHRLCQFKDAADELHIGCFPPGHEPFLVWGPGDEKPHALQPEQVQGIYEAFARKLDELGDFSRLRDAERERDEALEKLADRVGVVSRVMADRARLRDALEKAEALVEGFGVAHSESCLANENPECSCGADDGLLDFVSAMEATR